MLTFGWKQTPSSRHEKPCLGLRSARFFPATRSTTQLCPAACRNLHSRESPSKPFHPHSIQLSLASPVPTSRFSAKYTQQYHSSSNNSSSSRPATSTQIFLYLHMYVCMSPYTFPVRGCQPQPKPSCRAPGSTCLNSAKGIGFARAVDSPRLFAATAAALAVYHT